MAVTVIALLMIYFGDRVDFKIILTYLTRISPVYLSLGIITMCLNFFLSGERYRLILQSICERKFNILDIQVLTFGSLFFSHLVALGPSADLFRVGYCRKYLCISWKDSIVGALFDRIYVVFILALLGMTFVLFKQTFSYNFQFEFLFWFISLLFASVVFSVIYVLREKAKFINEIFNHMAFFFRTFLIGKNKVFLLLLTLGHPLSFVISIWILSIGLNLDIQLLILLFSSPLIILGQSLPLFFMGWGLRESAILFTLGYLTEIDTNQLLALSFVTGITVFLASLMFVPALIYGRLNSNFN